jgi:hypothetical protein
MRVMPIILAALALSGCATTPQPTVQALIGACPAMKNYTMAQEAAVSASMLKLPDNDPIVGFIEDYGQLRAEVRACSMGK